MPTMTEKLPNEPIVILTMPEDYNFKADAAADVERDFALLDSLAEPAYLIFDSSASKMDLSMLIEGSNMAVRGKNPLFHHPNARSIIYVTKSDLTALAAKGMDSEVFGNLNIKVFGTIEEALAHVRALA